MTLPLKTCVFCQSKVILPCPRLQNIKKFTQINDQFTARNIKSKQNYGSVKNKLSDINWDNGLGQATIMCKVAWLIAVEGYIKSILLVLLCKLTIFLGFLYCHATTSFYFS